MTALLVLGFISCGTTDHTNEPPGIWEGAYWLDDWFAVQRIDTGTFALFEPRSEYLNVNYLILGTERAVLFDSGPGGHDIRRAAETLTSLPIVVAFSHTHSDHIGEHELFDSVAALDHPTLRERTNSEGVFRPSILQYGGFDPRRFVISEWWSPDEPIELGSRRLRVLSVPGHTPESMALLDTERGQLFVGDFVYAGDLFAFGPGSNLSDYLTSTQRLLAATNANEVLMVCGAHVGSPEIGPCQSRVALMRLERALTELLAPGTHDWRLSWALGLPVRRHVFPNRLVILTSIFDDS